MNDYNKLLRVIGTNIKKYRKAKGLSLDKLGWDAGIEGSYIHSIEAGERNITIKTLLKISNTLEIPLWTLLVE